MYLKNIQTGRLILIPVTPDITNALIHGNIEEVEKLGIITDGTWPNEDTMDIVLLVNRAFQKDKIPSGFEFWIIVKKDDMKIIGDIGFHGKPDEKGEVEVGYGLVEQERGKGFGFEALRAIMDWAISQNNVKAIKAGCFINNIPSARILEKVGMKEINRDSNLIYWKFIKSLY